MIVIAGTKYVMCNKACARIWSPPCTKLHSSVGSVAGLRTGGRRFDLRLGQYSFRGWMIVIATGFIPLSPLSVVSTMVMWLGKNIAEYWLKKPQESMDRCIGDITEILIKNGVKHHSVNQSALCYRVTRSTFSFVDNINQ